MPRFLRNYAIVSFAAVLVGVILFVLTYRIVFVQGIVDLAQQNNITYGRTALRQIDAVLADYLVSTAGISPAAARESTLPQVLSTALADLMRDRGIARVKIYNQHGVVVFSSRRDQIGRDQSDNPGFQVASRGDVTAKLVYRDSFNPFDRATEDDNLVQTYIPVRKQPTEPVVGVLELYTDVNNLVHQAEHAELLILAIGALILPLLWIVTLLFVRHATRLIEAQEATIQERNATLATLSARMVQAEEAERKRLAVHLHEGLAQTLSAIKLALETVPDHRGAREQIGTDAIVPLLQKTIGEVRSMAMELRPPLLDDLGLLPAIAARCREVTSLHPDLDIQPHFAAAEADIPAPLKIVIYRSLEAALYDIARLQVARQVRVTLTARDDVIALAISHDGYDVPDVDAADTTGGETAALYGPLRERVVLTGGELLVEHGAPGWIVLRARWAPIAPPEAGARIGRGRSSAPASTP
jgi:signal transduction histidine kinase